MRTQYSRTAIGFLLLLLAAVLVGRSPSDALAQRKGGGKDGRGKEKDKDVPPPKFTLPDRWVKALSWRNIGPANMGGRITAIAVF